MMKKILIILTLFLVSCQPSTEAIEKAILETQAALPTVTLFPTASIELSPTPLPLMDIDLSDVIIISGDLPSGYSSGQIRTEPPEMFKNVNKFENVINQQFEQNGKHAGGTTIFLIEDMKDLEEAYKNISSEFGEEMKTENISAEINYLDMIGEQAKYSIVKTSLLGIKTENIDLVFTRCQSVTHIRMSNTSDLENVISYAKRLEKRLSEIICP
jgi:hypothetical protein